MDLDMSHQNQKEAKITIHRRSSLPANVPVVDVQLKAYASRSGSNRSCFTKTFKSFKTRPNPLAKSQ